MSAGGVVCMNIMETRNIRINRQEESAPASNPSQVNPNAEPASIEVPGVKKTGNIPSKRMNQTKARIF